ncbi:MAG: glycosyltransferase family 2 protein [Proteobacteria bacterium]|nr:glycosyltransferase family 2 protein [Pseudomonadota bacterium]
MRLSFTLPMLRGAWIKLIWRSGLDSIPERPVFRCVTRAGEFRDAILPAAVLGRGSWIGYISNDVVEIRISPQKSGEEFAFAIEAVGFLSLLELMQEIAGRNPLHALWALGAALIGRWEDSRTILRNELAGWPLAKYDTWRNDHKRSFGDANFDRMPTSSTRMVLATSLPAGQAVVDCPLYQSALDLQCEDWQLLVLSSDIQSSCPDRVVFLPESKTLKDMLVDAGDGLFAVLPSGARIDPDMFPALKRAAEQFPDYEAFMGDEEHVGQDGIPIGAWFKPAYDMLLFGNAPHLGHCVFWRLSALRERLAGSASDMRIKALRRPIISLPAGKREFGEIEKAIATSLPQPGLRADPCFFSIIVPTKNKKELLKACVDSIYRRKKSKYELIIVDNGSDELDCLRYFDSLSKIDSIKIIKDCAKFNFSSLCNKGFLSSSGDVVVFLNNDTEILEPDWLEKLASLARNANVGAVGARLLYPSGRVQHGNMTLGLGGRADHFEIGALRSDAGVFGRASIPHLVSAVTGACLALERAKFEAVGGFDALNLPVDLSDVDLCLRLREKGWHSALAGNVEIIHKESATRGRRSDTSTLHLEERRYFLNRWGDQLRDDPRFHPVYSLADCRARLG